MKITIAKCLSYIWFGGIGFIKGQNNKNHSVPCLPDKERVVGATKNKNEIKSISGERVPCTDNMSNCKNVDLESFVSHSDLSLVFDPLLGDFVNDIWGWTSENEREFALVGMSSGTSFVEITDPVNPIPLGELPTHTDHILWRDIKTYKDHAYIVSEADDHGMQVFDLTQLLTTSPTIFTTFSETFHYGRIGSAHNIFINEDSGFAYIVGSDKCRGGLHMVDIREHSNPTFAGCHSKRGYTHDVQCVNYDGPDTRYSNKEICFASNTDKVDIIDVTEKHKTVLISTFSYDDYGYTHQGWLTEDKKFFLIDDESDEVQHNHPTKTIICDVSNLENPTLKSFYLSERLATDHNQYVKQNFVYQSNYQAGLRILNLDDIENGELVEVAYYRTSSAWSNYPYFKSGVVAISDMDRGLYVVRPHLDSSMPTLPVPSSFPSISPIPSISAAPSSFPTLSSIPSILPSVIPSTPTFFRPLQFCFEKFKILTEMRQIWLHVVEVAM